MATYTVNRIGSAYPNYLNHRISIQRFIDDWAAITGNLKLSDHWDIEVRPYRDHEHSPQRYHIVPRPVDLHKFHHSDATEFYILMTACNAIDALAGYKGAWYFQALYGNRLSSDTIRIAADGLKAGRISFIKPLEAALIRWSEESYSF